MTDNLFQPFALNETINLNNRLLMAPLTRCMADSNLVPTQAMADYYSRRADAGLIISEAVIIRPEAQGYPNTPGLFTTAQLAGWLKVSDAVHGHGGKIFAQLWHTGRVAHPHFFGEGMLLPHRRWPLQDLYRGCVNYPSKCLKRPQRKRLLSSSMIMPKLLIMRLLLALMESRFMVQTATLSTNFCIKIVSNVTTNTVIALKTCHVLH